jgi:hypothetical protein
MTFKFTPNLLAAYDLNEFRDLRDHLDKMRTSLEEKMRIFQLARFLAEKQGLTGIEDQAATKQLEAIADEVSPSRRLGKLQQLMKELEHSFDRSDFMLVDLFEKAAGS